VSRHLSAVPSDRAIPSGSDVVEPPMAFQHPLRIAAAWSVPPAEARTPTYGCGRPHGPRMIRTSRGRRSAATVRAQGLVGRIAATCGPPASNLRRRSAAGWTSSSTESWKTYAGVHERASHCLSLSKAVTLNKVAPHAGCEPATLRLTA
jgi:hypothetical protein